MVEAALQRQASNMGIRPSADGSSRPLMEDLTPAQIVEELDRYVIGQIDAKRAVAVALRNRFRRQLLSEELRREITPKNILMIGPTGVENRRSPGEWPGSLTPRSSKSKRPNLPRSGTLAGTSSRSCEISSRFRSICYTASASKQSRKKRRRWPFSDWPISSLCR